MNSLSLSDRFRICFRFAVAMLCGGLLIAAEAIADEFHRLMSTSTYKGKNIFVETANSEYVSMGGRDSEMNFGLGRVKYSNLYLHDYVQYFHDEGLTTAVTDDEDREIAAMADLARKSSNNLLTAGKAIVVEGVKYEITTVLADNDVDDEADVVKFTSYSDVSDTADNNVAFTVAADDAAATTHAATTAKGWLQ